MTIQLNPSSTDPYESKTLADLRLRVFNACGFLSNGLGQQVVPGFNETLGTMRTYIFNMLGMAAMAAFPPPGVMSMLNGFINMAQQTAYRRLELAQLYTANTPYLVNDTDQLTVEPTVVRMLALAQAKAHYGQEDAEIYLKQAEQYFQQMAMRVPPNAVTAVTRMLSDAQFELYRRYELFRTERWFTWTFVAGQRFYGTQSNDERLPIPTPSGVTVTQGPAGNFGSMNTSRELFGAGITNGSQALMVGGIDATGQITATAEIYNTVTGLFTPTGGMATARMNPNVVTLNDGLTLVAGGYNGDSLSSSEIYNPVTGTFFAAGNMNLARRLMTPVLLKKGKVLFAGGTGPNNTATNTAETFDQTTGAFTPTSGNLISVRSNYGIVALNTGKAIIAGGTGLTNAELYDDTTNTFSTVTPPVGIAEQTVGVLLGNGKAFFCGGIVSGTTTDQSLIYDPAANQFNGPFGLVTMTTPRKNHTATLLPNGKVLIVGGQNAGGVLNSAELYDPQANTFTAVPGNILGARQNHVAILPAGSVNVLIAGGDSGAAGLTTAVLYNYVTNTFSSSGATTSGLYSYRIAFSDFNGKTTNASAEVTSALVAVGHAVQVTWNPPTNANANMALIYGRAAGVEAFIGQVPASTGVFIDTLTVTPFGALPTSNTTGNVGPILDPRQVSWVGVSRGDVDWRALAKGVPPEFYSNQTNGIPAFYDIREQIEVWPPPMDATWQLHIKGHYTLAPFEADTDTTSLDWQAVYLLAVADAKNAFKQPDVKTWAMKFETYIGDLIAGQHGTARYTPGTFIKPNAVRPVLLNSQGQPI